jgi:hypothetical protein
MPELSVLKVETVPLQLVALAPLVAEAVAEVERLFLFTTLT